jgi:hypothetical protein
VGRTGSDVENDGTPKVQHTSDTTRRELERRAATALRCAELRERATAYDAMFFDEFCVWVACQLRDFADLLEAVDREGWR